LQQGEQFEQPKDLSRNPELRRLHRKLIAFGISAFVALSCLLVLLRWQALKYIQAYERQRLSQAAHLASRSALERLAHYSRLAEALASSAQFSAPADSAVDSARFEELGIRDARRAAEQNHVDSWLQTEYGPSVKPQMYRYEATKFLPMWHVTRGLPLESAHGKALAESRRQIVQPAIMADRSILHITELDPNGRVIFLAPYGSQLRLRCFNAAPILLPPVPTARNDETRIRVHATLIEGGVDAVSFIAPVQRKSASHFLVVTVAKDMGAEVDPYYTFGLFDGSGQLLMYAGDDLGKLTQRTAQNTPGVITLQTLSTSYTLRMTLAPSPASAALWGLVAFVLAIPVVIFLFFNQVIWNALIWICRLQWKLDSVQKQVQRRVQDLAHDFQNRIFALRTIMGNISGRLTLD
jgi:hypothetical protein